MAKSKKKKKKSTKKQPYFNMPARKGVLIAGTVVVFLSFIVVLYASLCLFVPAVNFFKQVSPLYLLIGLLSGGVALAFVGTVFVIAGANVKKSLARLSMFFGVNVFLIGLGILIVVLLLRTLIPLEALRRLAECFTAIPSALI